MKKTIFLFLLSASVSGLFAQSVKFGVKGGLNISTADLGGPLPGTDITSKAGFNAGAFAEFEFNNWSVEPGLFYTTKGANGKDVTPVIVPGTGQQFPTKFSARYNYLEVPLNVLYNVKVKPGKIFFGGGPYYGIALSGESKETISEDGTINNYDSKIPFGSSSSDLKKFDFGVNALAGITLKNGLLFSVDYGHGFTNISHTNNYLKNRVFSFSVGYEFL